MSFWSDFRGVFCLLTSSTCCETEWEGDQRYPTRPHDIPKVGVPALDGKVLEVADI